MRRTIIALLPLILILMACGGAGEPENSQNEVNLTQSTTFDADGGTVTVHYPEGWTVDEAFGQISFINSGDVESLEVTGITEGLVTGIITVVQSAGATLDDLAAQFVGGTMESEGIATERFTLIEREGLHLITTEGATRRETLIVSMDAETMVLMTVLGTQNTLDQVRDTLRAMAAGIEFSRSD